MIRIQLETVVRWLDDLDGLVFGLRLFWQGLPARHFCRQTILLFTTALLVLGPSVGG